MKLLTAAAAFTATAQSLECNRLLIADERPLVKGTIVGKASSWGWDFLLTFDLKIDHPFADQRNWGSIIHVTTDAKRMNNEQWHGAHLPALYTHYDKPYTILARWAKDTTGNHISYFERPESNHDGWNTWEVGVIDGEMFVNIGGERVFTDTDPGARKYKEGVNIYAGNLIQNPAKGSIRNLRYSTGLGVDDCMNNEEWGEWTACDRSCGGGVSTRTRIENGVTKTETNACNAQDCPSQCEWSEWSQWTTCSVTCAGGEQTRLRMMPETENDVESRACEEGECPSWSDWSDWSACDVTCGAGIQVRTQTKPDWGVERSEHQLCHSKNECWNECPHSEWNQAAAEKCTGEFALDYKGYVKCEGPGLYALCVDEKGANDRKCKKLARKFGPFKSTGEDHRSRRGADKRLAMKAARKAGKSEISTKASKGAGKCYQRCHDKGMLPTFDELSKCIKANAKAAKTNSKLINKGTMPPFMTQ